MHCKSIIKHGWCWKIGKIPRNTQHWSTLCFNIKFIYSKSNDLKFIFNNSFVPYSMCRIFVSFFQKTECLIIKIFFLIRIRSIFEVRIVCDKFLWVLGYSLSSKIFYVTIYLFILKELYTDIKKNCHILKDNTDFWPG